MVITHPANFSIQWAMQIISSPWFRLFLLIFFSIAVIRWILQKISLGRLVRISIALFLIGIIPQLVTFFRQVVMHFFVPVIH